MWGVLNEQKSTMNFHLTTAPRHGRGRARSAPIAVAGEANARQFMEQDRADGFGRGQRKECRDDSATTPSGYGYV